MKNLNSPTIDSDQPTTEPDSPRDRVWAGLIGVSFVVSMALAYRPMFASIGDLLSASLPWLALAGMVLAWAGKSFPMRLAGFSIAVVAWYPMVSADDRWTMLSFALYGLAFIVDSTRLRVGLTLAAMVSAVWTVASIGSPTWTLLIPTFVFLAAATIAYAIARISRLTAVQAKLIRQLESTRGDLAASERSRGALEERARFAGEIHDTLAQGLTSIVLLARAGQREAATAEKTLGSIEMEAQDNLNKARRLVESTSPDELKTASLLDALERHLASALPHNVDGTLTIRGEVKTLPGSVETVLLRSAQEGIRNAYSHAAAQQVDVTLSYLTGAVELRVSDDGIGTAAGTIHDRGSLTGGQGLAALTRRVELLSGTLDLESAGTRGSVLTVRLPAES